MDIIECWRWLCQHAAKSGAKELIVAGDLYNNRTTIDLTVLDAVCREVLTASKMFDAVRILVGNHDSHLRTPAINSLQSLTGNATVVEAPYVVAASGIGMVPWTDDLTAFRTGVDAVSKMGATILVTHALIEGVVPKGGIPLEYLSPKKFKRVFVGDVHDPIDVPGANNVHYIGSPMQIDWRDAGHQRGFILYDEKKDKIVRVLNLTSPRFLVVTYAGEAKGVNKGDFVRVENEDPEEAEKAVAAVKSKSAVWVEETNVVLEAAAPRLEIHASDHRATVLETYVRYCLPDGDDATVAALVAEGLNVLAAVKT